MKKETRGGFRPNAKRPLIGEHKREKLVLTLDPSTIKKVTELAKAGNISRSLFIERVLQKVLI